MIQDAFLKHAATSPDATAIVHGEHAWTYQDVEQLSARLAHRLLKAGVQPGGRVAVLAERGPQLVWTLLAALRIGAVFTVLDSAYPDGRLSTLLRICAADVLVTAGSDALQDVAVRLTAEHNLPIVSARSEAAGDGARLDQGAPEDAAYFLFTSGSTGTPKCVACSHIPLRHFIEWHIGAFGLTATDCFTMLSGLSHDPLLRDIFTPLSLGAVLAIPRQNQITEPGALRPWFKAVRATVAHLTPALGQLLAAGGGAVSLPDLRHMFWGGDQLRSALIRKVAGIAPAARHVNFYGSTETPQAAAYHVIDPNRIADVIPVGRGSDGFELLVVDDDKAPVPTGVVGEIAVKSRFLTLGYVERGDVITEASGGRDPDGARIYYTGDRGHVMPNGDVMLMGRADDQVKIRGYRVEMSEVTSALLSHDLVGSAIALPVGEASALRIEAFVAADVSSPDFERELAAHLAERLPSYMAPSKIWIRNSLPLLPNGKIDRRTLQADSLGAVPTAAAPAARPSSTAEGDLIAAWARIFPGVRLSGETSFLSLGGDSLSYVGAYLAAEEVVGVVPQDWVGKTIAELAGARVQRSRIWGVIDSSMLIRAVSITLVVAVHFELTKWGQGVTGALFLVSGFLFGGLQLKDVFARASSAPILRSLKNILAPTLAFTALMIGLDYAIGKPPPIQAWFLSMDLVDQGLNGVARHDGFLWYVDCLLKMLLVLYLTTLALPKSFKLQDRRLEYVAGLFAVGCLGRFALPFLIQPDFFQVTAPTSSLVQFSIFTNFSTFALGVLLATAAATRARYWALAAAFAYALINAPAYGVTNGVAIAGAAAALVLMSRVTLPRPLCALIFLVSSASLYIYLTHLVFGEATAKLLGPAQPWAQFAVSMAGGLATYEAVKRVRAILTKLRFGEAGSSQLPFAAEAAV